MVSFSSGGGVVLVNNAVTVKDQTSSYDSVTDKLEVIWKEVGIA
jgi:hypothetical protein